ncbi:MAG: transglutaminase family protein [Gemmatimonadetes bacterium]|nr:transglutaminase family protein [Gemmatimonadota bacterium]
MAKNVRYRIEHVTKYRYGYPVRNCAMSLALKPLEDHGQRVSAFRLETEPEGSVFEVTDAFGNARHQLHLNREHQSLFITARSTVDVMSRDAPPEGCDEGAWATIRGWRDSFHHRDFLDHSGLAVPSPALERFVQRSGVTPAGDPLAVLRRLSGALYECFEYVPGSTTISSTIEHILDTGRGVCQDYAHVMIAIARTWGIPARYVSGYVHDVTAADSAAGGAGGGGGGRGTTSHAWVECLLPGPGWTGFDPTNAILADERHVRVAMGRDYQDVSPTRGVLFGGGDIQLEVEVSMEPVPEHPVDSSYSTPRS